MSRRCTACGQEPSGLIPRTHDFCEHCGAPLAEAPRAQVTLTCYRCGQRFDGAEGATLCLSCQQTPAVAASTEVPVAPQNAFASAAFWGAAWPVAVRLAFGLLVGEQQSREARALVGVIAFFAGTVVIAVLGVITGQSTRKSDTTEQAIALTAAAVTIGLLWALT